MRVLILSASVGGGHVRAAQAIELALKQQHPDVECRMVDVLELTNKAFRRIYGKAYFDLFNHMPHAVGYLYDLMDKPATGKRIQQRLRRLVQKINLKKLKQLLVKQPWDLIINTHFLPSEIVACLHRDGKLATPQVTVVTDFDVHGVWMCDPTDRYFTATMEGKKNLAGLGVDEDIIQVAGIPIDPVFSIPADRDACLRQLHLAGDRPIVLQLAGGFGVGPLERIYSELTSITTPMDLIVVTGKNEKAYRKLTSLPQTGIHRVTVLGFTTQMDALLTVADLAVTKPGGLTTSEALARGTALVVVNPIPGQEGRNSDFILENGCGIKANNLFSLGYKVQTLLDDKPRLQQMKANALAHGKPRAAFDVVEASLKVANEAAVK